MKVLAALLLLACALGARVASAHDDIHIVGTLTRIAGLQIEVRSATGRVAHLRMDGFTIVKRDAEKLDQQQLKTGQRVFVEAYGDSADDALAIEIRIMKSGS